MKQFIRVVFLMGPVVFLATAQSDPPGRVGRLSYMTGAVSFRPGDMEDWVSADYNRPLTTGDHLWTDDGSRAELHIGGTALRLNSRTAFEFLNLDDANVQIRLTEGSLNVHVRGLADQETFEVDTPNLAFTVLRPGDYRIDVSPDNQSTYIIVRGGEGEVTGGGQAFAVHPRQQVAVSGGDSISYNVAGAPQLDDWDGWCAARDRREDQSPSARYVSRDLAGYQDLDDNGSWREVPEYGSVWVPNAVATGWAPYHNGHWVWVEPWGWTWVDDAPWGFAPFHYGRWVYVGYWAWVPGPLSVRPVYAPALVAWVGGGNFGVGVSFGGGAGVGWFPLGPREVYVPAYHASPAYLNRVNVTNTTIVNVNITNVYVNRTYINRSAPGAVTAVPQNAFASARPVQSVAVRVDSRAVQSATVINAAPVAPSRQSVLGNSGNASRGMVKQPPAAVQNRAVVAKATPPAPRVPFAQRQQALVANPGRPLDSAQVERLRTAQPAPARPLIRQVQAPANPSRPGGQVAAPTPAAGANQNPPPARDNARPLERDSRPVTHPQNQAAPAQNNAPPARVQPNVARPPQNNAPSPRVQPNVARPPENSAPPARVQPNMPRSPQNNAPSPRVQPNVPSTSQNNAPPRRAQPNVASPTQNNAPPQRQNDRPAEGTRPQPRAVEPPARAPERPAQREAPKTEKKDDKKDKKDKKDEKNE